MLAYKMPEVLYEPFSLKTQLSFWLWVLGKENLLNISGCCFFPFPRTPQPSLFIWLDYYKLITLINQVFLLFSRDCTQGEDQASNIQCPDTQASSQMGGGRQKLTHVLLHLAFAFPKFLTRRSPAEMCFKKPSFFNASELPQVPEKCLA